MTTSQFFVYKRPVAWTALVATLLWGCLAYWAMPQRHDPIIPIRIATFVTIYPGAEAEKVEQEVTRKIENQVGQCGQVEKVYSLSRQNLSVVFVELFESVKDPEQVWQDLQGRVESLSDLPSVRGRPVRPQINKDFGETVALMLTISSPKVSDFEIRQRAKSIRADATEVSRQPAHSLSARPLDGPAGLSEHGGALVRSLARPKPFAAAHGEGADRGRADRRAAQHRLPRFPVGLRENRPSVDPRGNPLGARHGGHRHVASRHVAGHYRPRPLHAGRETGPVEARSVGRARPLQLPRTAPLCRSHSRPAEAVSHDRQDRRDRPAERGHSPVLQQPPLQRTRSLAADDRRPTGAAEHQSARRPRGNAPSKTSSCIRAASSRASSSWARW